MAELQLFQPGKTFYDSFQQGRGNTLAKLAITGDQTQRKGALADLYGLNPEMAQAAQSQIKANDEQDYADLIDSAKVMYSLKGRPEADMMWQRVAPKFSQKYGVQFNPTPQPSDWDAIEKIVQMAGAQGGKPKARSSHILADGTIAFMDEFGNLTRTGEKASNSYGFQTDAEGNVFAQDRRGGTVAPAPMGSVQQGMPQVQQGADPMAGGLDRINQGVQVLKSNGVPVEQINAWADAEFAKLQGTVQQGVVEQAPAQTPTSQARVAVKTEAPKPKEAPSGYQYNAAGTLEPIKGGPADPEVVKVGGEKLTDDMRKTSTLLSRMDFALNQIRDVEAMDKSANRPGYGVAAIDYLPDALGNDLKSAGRQQIEAAQLDALDAALTLATGAAYTKEQLFGLRKAYFPQPNDSEATIKAKQARFENVIQSARVRAGNAAQAPIKPPAGGKPVQIRNADDYNRLPSGTQYLDPNGKLRVKK
jgi:hypothetical protein